VHTIRRVFISLIEVEARKCPFVLLVLFVLFLLPLLLPLLLLLLLFV
jgi:hypothetical protein